MPDNCNVYTTFLSHTVQIKTRRNLLSLLFFKASYIKKKKKRNSYLDKNSNVLHSVGMFSMWVGAVGGCPVCMSSLTFLFLLAECLPSFYFSPLK